MVVSPFRSLNLVYEEECAKARIDLLVIPIKIYKQNQYKQERDYEIESESYN